MKHKNRYFTLIENEEQINFVLSYLEKCSIPIEDVLFYALTPNTYAKLKDQSLSAIRFTAFFKNTDHEFATKEVFKHVEEVESQSTDLKEQALNFTFIYYYQWIVSYIILLEISLKNIKAISSDNEIFICPETNIIDEDDPLMTSAESFLRMVADKLNLINIIYYPILKTINKKKINPILSFSSRCLTKFHLSLLGETKKTIFFLDSYSKGLEEILSRTQKSSLRRYIYLRGINSFGNLSNSDVLKNISFSFSSVLDHIFKTNLTSKLLKKRIHGVLNINDFYPKDFSSLKEMDSTSLGSIDSSYQSILKNKIEKGIMRLVASVDHRSQIFEKLFKSKSIEGVAAIDSVGDDAILGILAAKYKKKGLIISHGSHPSPSDELSKVQFHFHSKGLIDTPFPYCAVQTPLAENFLKNYTDNKSQLFKTGPLIWGPPSSFSKKQKSLDDEMIIVHAGTQKSIYHMRYYIYESSDEYILELNRLISILRGLKKTRLIIKFRESDDLSLKTLKSLLDKGDYSIEVQKPFSDLLEIADVVVSYSSTTIEEGIEARVPVILFGGSNRFRFIPDFGDENSPVFWCKTKEETLKALEKIKTFSNWNWTQYVYEEKEDIIF